MLPSHPPAQLPRVPIPPIPTTSSPPATTPTPTPSPQTPHIIPPSPQRHANNIYVNSEKPLFPQHEYGTRFKSQAADYLLAQHLFQTILQPQVNHIYNSQGKKETIDTLLKGADRDIWTQALSNEIGRLAQGNDAGVRFTDTIEFILKSEVPLGRDVTYASFVCDHRPLKTEPNRIRLVVGGDKLSYDDDAGSPAAGLLETKILLNSVISDAKKGARFFTADLKDHFLASPMERPEYMKIPFHRFPPDIVKRYQLDKKVAEDGYVYIKIKRGMYGLKQAAILAYRHLINVLKPYGYEPCKYSLGLWKHKTRPTIFCLCVDDFGVKYFNEDDKQHLLNALQDHYKITVDHEGQHYCGLTITWNYQQGYVDIEMPGYNAKTLDRLQHPPPSKPQFAPHKWNKPIYGKHTQLAPSPDTSQQLSAKDTKYIQSAVGAYLYYARALEHTMLPALNEIGTTQAKPTEKTMNAVKQLLDYAHTRPNAKIRFHASDMILYVDSDAAYLVLPNAKSRIAGYYYLSNKQPPLPAIPNPPMNGAISVECSSLPLTVTSAAESETGGLFVNGKKIIPIRTTLEEINHPQPGPTPLKTDNKTAKGFCHKTIKQKQSKAWDMRYHWLRDREILQQIAIYWDKGIRNLADYFTKHFPAKYHKEIRQTYLLNAILEATRGGCIDTLAQVSQSHVTRGPITVAINDIATAILSSLNNTTLIN